MTKCCNSLLLKHLDVNVNVVVMEYGTDARYLSNLLDLDIYAYLKELT
jgi:hypothetical protein